MLTGGTKNALRPSLRPPSVMRRRVPLIAAPAFRVSPVPATKPLRKSTGTGMAAFRPMPIKLADCAPLKAPSVTVSVPRRVPAMAGAKVILMMQLVPASSDAGQLFVCWKSLLTVMLETGTVPGPWLVTVTAWAALVVPTFWLPNARLAGLNDTNGATTPGVWKLQVRMSWIAVDPLVPPVKPTKAVGAPTWPGTSTAAEPEKFFPVVEAVMVQARTVPL